jgi:hypothetical protein
MRGSPLPPPWRVASNLEHKSALDEKGVLVFSNILFLLFGVLFVEFINGLLSLCYDFLPSDFGSLVAGFDFRRLLCTPVPAKESHSSQMRRNSGWRVLDHLWFVFL